MASGRDFPFTIMDVASLLRLNIRRRGGSRVVYADCPICGDRRGKLGLYPQIDTWRCYHCGECGGMLALYGKVHGISNSDAYQEICDALMVGTPGREYTPKAKVESAPEEPQTQRASPQEVHRTLTALLALLTLSPAHREHLRTKRGLTDGEIARFGFKSTPPAYQCRAIATQLMKQGCTVEGIPGFYLDGGGRWRAKFHQRTSGIVIPLRGVDGLLQGLQIRLDHPIKKGDDPPGKTGAKYLPFTSTGKPMGVTSGNPIHFVGDPSSRVVYVTEGALKADIAHALMGRTFAATVGVNNTMGMDELFAFLRRNGTEEIIEAEDMDKYCNPNVSRGASKVHQLAVKNGLKCRRLVWNPNYKGIDDWLLALRRKETKEKEREHMNFKEMYLNGMCPFGYIDSCADQWRSRPNTLSDYKDYLEFCEELQYDWDIYGLDEHGEEIVEIDGFGEKSWENLWDAIQRSRDTTFERYLIAMDIPLIGRTASKALAQRFHSSLDEFESAVIHQFDFTQLPDFGETLHQNIYQWFQNEDNWYFWSELRNHVRITAPAPQETAAQSGPFVGKTIVVTGKVEPYTRDGISAEIESLGGHAGSSVSKKTDYLVCGENAGSKLAKAKELGVTVLTPAQFFLMAGK